MNDLIKALLIWMLFIFGIFFVGTVFDILPRRRNIDNCSVPVKERFLIGLMLGAREAIKATVYGLSLAIVYWCLLHVSLYIK